MKDYLMFGFDILFKEYCEVILFCNGDFILLKYMKVFGKYYDMKIGKEFDEFEIDKLEDLFVKKEFEMFDKIINGDLLCFYELKGFMKVNFFDYDYIKYDEDFFEMLMDDEDK